MNKFESFMFELIDSDNIPGIFVVVLTVLVSIIFAFVFILIVISKLLAFLLMALIFMILPAKAYINTYGSHKYQFIEFIFDYATDWS
jgi:hypothetical protein